MSFCARNYAALAMLAIFADEILYNHGKIELQLFSLSSGALSISG